MHKEHSLYLCQLYEAFVNLANALGNTTRLDDIPKFYKVVVN